MITYSNNEEKLKLNYLQVYKYSSKVDILLITIGIMASLVTGANLLTTYIVLSSLVDTFLNHFSDEIVYINSNTSSAATVATKEPIYPLIVDRTKYFLIIAISMFFAGIIKQACWFIASQNQCHRIRLKLFHSMLNKNIAWHDVHSAGSLVLHLTDHISIIENGIGEKAFVFIHYFSGSVGAYVSSFVFGWRLAIVSMALIPFVVVSVVAFNLCMKFVSKKEIIAYEKAAAIAEEVLSSIKTVYAFSGEKKEVNRFSNSLDKAYKAGVKKSIIIGLCISSMSLFFGFATALVFWYGTKLVVNQIITPGVVVQVFFCVVVGSVHLGNALPSLEYFSNSTAAANEVFSIIEQKPKNKVNFVGKKLNKMNGKIEFQNVQFHYPTRSEVTIFNDFNLTIKAGETVALVGPSGSGKTTLMQILLRFYDPVNGKVFIDDEDFTELDLRWYRSHIGVVLQEPLLFTGTVMENILFGKPDATTQEVEKSAREAHAHDFIMKLPQNYNTFIGENGNLLSVGQKQRIAIARALIRNPTILLLDEATSALDNRSEKVVQDALDHVTTVGGRTVIMSAHRLSTIRNVNRIIVLDNGVILEMGNHDELMKLGGWYANAIKNQLETSMKNKEINKGETSENYEDELENDLIGLEFKDKSTKDKKESSVDVVSMTHGGVLRVLKTNATEWAYLVFGCLCASMSGAVQPAFAAMIAEFIKVFTLIKYPNEMLRLSRMYAGIITGLAVFSFLTGVGKTFLFGIAGERLTLRLRVMLFKSILKQEVAWFDEKANQSGILTTRLASDASKIQGISGSRLGVFCETFVTFIAAFAIGFAFSWQITLTMMAFLPLLIFVGIIQGRAISGVNGTGSALDLTAQNALEILNGIRTVVSLGLENHMYDKFCNSLNQNGTFIRQVIVLSILEGIFNCVFTIMYAAVFTLGGRLVDDDETNFVIIFRVFMVIMFSCSGIGRAMSFAPDVGKASEASENIFSIIDRLPNSVNQHGIGKIPDNINGAIQFKNVSFRYPTRLEVNVLQDITFSVQPGTTVALVGASGCGKTTIMSFLIRFYEAQSGSIELDDNNLKDLDVDWLRRQCGLVSQEPRLFNCSILENIAYGDNSRENIPIEEIIEVAKQVNAHHFISTFPEGYDTTVGSRGSQLSGGQKQRIAIARALLRKPKILLLDEGTSALDSESEIIVQEALDAVREQCTCLVIAHRLSSIRNADNIIVLQDGHVVEQGTHDKLMQLQGVYYNFLHLDSSKTIV